MLRSNPPVGRRKGKMEFYYVFSYFWPEESGDPRFWMNPALPMLMKSDLYWHVMPNPKSRQNPVSWLITWDTNIEIKKSSPKTTQGSSDPCLVFHPPVVVEGGVSVCCSCRWLLGCTDWKALGRRLFSLWDTVVQDINTKHVGTLRLIKRLHILSRKLLTMRWLKTTL